MQNINFYHALQKPSPYDITFGRAIKIISLLLVLLIGISIMQTVYLAGQKGVLLHYESRLSKLPQEIAQLSDVSPDLKRVVILSETLKQYDKKILAQNELLQKNAKGYFDATFVPSSSFRDLAQLSTQKVWFTHLNFSEHGQVMTLNGFSMSTAHLLALVSELQKQTAFRDFSWSVSTTPSVDDPKKNQRIELGFTLTTKPATT